MIEESIYSLIPAPKGPYVNTNPLTAPMFKSSRSGNKSPRRAPVPPTASTFGFDGTSKVLGNVPGELATGYEVHPAKRPGATFGRDISGTIDPHTFLKKVSALDRSRDAAKSISPVKRSRSSEAHRPAVPKKSEKPIMGLKSDKNFVVANAVESILKASKHPPKSAERAVDRATFGQVPEYLTDIKAQLKSGPLSYGGIESQKPAEPQSKELSEDELRELKATLASRRAAVNKQFLSLSVSLQTQSQLKRKETLERDLRSLDVAIAKLANKKHVMVVEG